MNRYVDIRRFYSARHYMIEICGLKRRMPLCQVEDEMWLVGNDSLSFGCDVEFTTKIGKELALRLKKFEPDVILAPEAKSIGIAYEIAKNLKHKHFVLARKNRKLGVLNILEVEIASITTGEKQKLFLDGSSINLIAGKRVALVDDVISTGQTILGLKSLASRAGAKVCAIGAIWLEGPWPFEKLSKEFKRGCLIYLGILPLFAKGDVYKRLNGQARKVLGDIDVRKL